MFDARQTNDSTQNLECKMQIPGEVLAQMSYHAQNGKVPANYF